MNTTPAAQAGIDLGEDGYSVRSFVFALPFLLAFIVAQRFFFQGIALSGFQG